MGRATGLARGEDDATEGVDDGGGGGGGEDERTGGGGG